jgi:hypothetical protein
MPALLGLFFLIYHHVLNGSLFAQDRSPILLFSDSALCLGYLLEGWNCPVDKDLGVPPGAFTRSSSAYSTSPFIGSGGTPTYPATKMPTSLQAQLQPRSSILGPYSPSRGCSPPKGTEKARLLGQVVRGAVLHLLLYGLSVHQTASNLSYFLPFSRTTCAGVHSKESVSDRERERETLWQAGASSNKY